jgi:hypothetical protein
VIHLYEFTFEHNVEYVFSTLPSEEVRKYRLMWDHADVPVHIFNATFEKGTVKEIKSKEDLWSADMLNIIPYATEEQLDSKLFFDLDCSIGEFLRLGQDETWRISILGNSSD